MCGSGPSTSSSTRRITRCSWMPKTRAFYEGRGWDLDRWMGRGIELDNHVIGDHPDVTFAFHLCRGNQGSRWLVSGSYEPLARRIFGGINARAADARVRRRALAATSSPWRTCPRTRSPSSASSPPRPAGARRPKSSRPASARRREFVPLERLALSPQCGFATSIVGNALSVEDEEHKLRTIVETAEKVWG